MLLRQRIAAYLTRPSWADPDAAAQLNTVAGAENDWFGGTAATYASLGLAIAAAAVIFTRASTGGYMDAAGNYTSFASGQPRIGTRGLLIQPGATNNLLQSANFSTSWTGGGGSYGTFTAPDGNTATGVFTEDTSTGAHGSQQNRPIASNVAYTYSMYVIPSNRTWIRLYITDTGSNSLYLYFNLSGNGSVGSLTATGTSSLISSGIERYTSGLYRVWITVLLGSTNTGAIQTLYRWAPADNTASYTGTGVVAGTVWGAQLELANSSNRPTAYIPTTSSTVTRLADACTLKVADGRYDVPVTFADGTTSTQSAQTLTGGAGWAIPTSLPAYYITKLKFVRS